MEVHVSEETLREMENIFKENDVEVETVQIGNKDIRISGYQDIRISGYQRMYCLSFLCDKRKVCF